MKNDDLLEARTHLRVRRPHAVAKRFYGGNVPGERLPGQPATPHARIRSG
jgi:hypothetical protein